MECRALFLLASLAFVAACSSGSAIAASTVPTPTLHPATTPAPAQNVGIFPSYNLNPIAADDIGMTSTAVQIASRIRLGWNLGNSLESLGGETGWFNPKVSPELIRLVRASGFDAVRIPVSWNQHANQKTAKIDAAWLDRVKQVVKYCVDNNLYVIVNTHWDGGWLERNVTADKQAATNAKQRALWEQIATHLRDFDEHLLFASANEPNVSTEEQVDVLNSYHQTFIDAVRATGGKNSHRVLVVQGPAADVEKSVNWWTLPKDTVGNKLMAEMHFYTPYNFVLMTRDEAWGKPAYYWGSNFRSSTDSEHNSLWGEEAAVNELFTRVKQKFIYNEIPVILGEYTAIRRRNLTGESLKLHQASRKYYLKYVTQRALENGLVPFYWDDGSGVFDRSNNTVRDQTELDALLTGAGKR
ncbi:glycoside hydrolase family 5 protein [Pelomonas sp. Root1217]|uniref:glycoside hydrolase family 5 protein n=1 Tax=Pelomonas sp. Root1217 TaxID=1736430 RepID=UPI000A54299D|nr:glycoside hydrolase family 5 protein [Pelomonas sp. Root1217]